MSLFSKGIQPGQVEASETGFRRVVADTTRQRMLDLAELFTSGVTEVTGKRQNRLSASEVHLLNAEGKEEYEHSGRFKGVKASTALAGFSAGPKQLAAAIRGGNRRGPRGRLYRSIRRTMKKFVLFHEEEQIREFLASPEGRRAVGVRIAAERRALIQPHAAVRVCRSCSRAHSFAAHSSHGQGAFGRTHETSDAREAREEREAMRSADWGIL